MPSLREHREDMPELANLLLARLVEAKEVPPRHFSTAALNALRNYDWPGNLAQLEARGANAGADRRRRGDRLRGREPALLDGPAARPGASAGACRSTCRCARRATPSSASISSTTSPARAAT